MNIIKQNWPTQTKYIFHWAGFSARVTIKNNGTPILRDLYVEEDCRHLGEGTRCREYIERYILNKYGKICVHRSPEWDTYYLSVGYKILDDGFLIKR